MKTKMRRATAFAILALVPIALAGLLVLAWFAYTVLAPGGSSAAPAASSSLTCSVESTACAGDEVEVFRMSNTANAHAGTPAGSSYTYRVCCGGVDGLGTNCSGTYDTVLALSGTTNAHVATTVGGAYTTDVCLSVTDGTADCTHDASCGTGYQCLATISGTTNAHVADCDGSDDYATKVCCQVESGADCTPGVDTDLDDFDNDVECYLGTDPGDDCTNNPGVHDAWPLDMNMDKVINLGGDVYAYAGNLGKQVSIDPSVTRLDLNMDGVINLGGDVYAFAGKLGNTCT